MTTLTLATDVRIARPAEPVWALIADYANDPRWRHGVRSMVPTPAGPVCEGTVTHEVMRLAGSTYTNQGLITDVTPGRHFTWRTTHGADADGSRTVEPDGPGACVVRLRLTVRLHGAQRLAAPLFRSMLQRNLTGDGERLRILLES